LENVDVNIPPLPEQRKIATVLHTVDKAIEKTEEIIERLNKIKKGIVQNVVKNGVNGEQKIETDTRFGRLPESWEFHPLKEIGEIAGRTAPEKDESECWGGDIPWATPSEITSLERPTISDTEEHLTEVALERVSSNLLPPGSVLLTTRATIGECAINTVEMTTNQGFKNFIPSEEIDTWYAYYRLGHAGDYLASLSKGSTFPEVGKETVESLVIPVPSFEEQKEIGERLRSVDNMIISYKSYKDQLVRLKRGQMQDLFSGTVRTADASIEVPDVVAQHG
jgi:type I restriction enzyme S subunit